jgi:hypothetical protein
LVFQDAEKRRSMVDSILCFFDRPRRKVAKTSNKTSCPSPNVQNRVTFVERGAEVKRLRIFGWLGGEAIGFQLGLKNKNIRA